MKIEEIKGAIDEFERTWVAFQEENDRCSLRNDQALEKMNARMNQIVPPWSRSDSE